MSCSCCFVADGAEAGAEVHPSICRATLKLVTLQRRCRMDTVSLQHIKVALRSLGRQEVELTRQEVTHALDRMFHAASQEVPRENGAVEETCSLMFGLYDRTQSGRLSADSFQTALIGLSAESLLVKYRALLGLAENGSGLVSRSGLRCLLDDLSQIPSAVKEEALFGGVEAAVTSCFTGVSTPMLGRQHVLSWLQSEPHLLLWLPTLYRLAISQKVTHNVRCHTCKTAPIAGLRYRCRKCLNVQVCQSCFLSGRESVRHRSRHPMMAFCTQPTWRESLSSLARSARRTLLPRRHTQREADMRAEEGGAYLSSPPPTDVTTPAVSAANQNPSSNRIVSHDASVQTPSLQVDSESQQVDQSLLTEVRNLQRDKWLLEEQLQVWKVTVQSEQGILGNRCSEMEVTMETLREDNLSLQTMLTKALNEMEAQRHAIERVQSETESNVTSSDSEGHEAGGGDDEEQLTCSEEEQPSPPIMHQVASHDTHCEDEDAGERFLHPVGRQDNTEGSGPQGTCLSKETEEWDCGSCSPDQLLQEAVERLKTEMEVDTWTKRETDDRRGAELLTAAAHVGESVHLLVDAMGDETRCFKGLEPALDWRPHRQ
ncbi:dystrotelin [Antennarius striatus]|uniref:dystrotelin n=1 Tax=Antennarius striatus TaxID=241820 RepID=UPI0035B02CF9